MQVFLILKFRSFKSFDRIIDTGGLPGEQKKGVGFIWFHTNWFLKIVFSKTSLLKTTEVCGWTKKLLTKRDGGMKVSTVLRLTKWVYGRHGRKGKLVKRNIWLLGKHANMLSAMPKRKQRKRSLHVSNNT